MNAERLVAGYRALRDKKSEIESRHKEELAPIRKMMFDIENRMLQEMQRQKMTSIKTEHGTAYQTTKVSATVADREAFRGYCESEDAWELADIRASKTAIRAMREETGDLPPGITWREELSVNFKK